jgi:hypothetical protein
MTCRTTNAKSSGWATAAANERGVTRKQPRSSQLANAFRDRGPSKARDPDDVSLRCRALKANCIEYPGDAVKEAIIPVPNSN